jgi:hypothetical protein
MAMAARVVSILVVEVSMRDAAATRVVEALVLVAAPMGRVVGSIRGDVEAAMALVVAKAIEAAEESKVMYLIPALVGIMFKERLAAQPV